VIRREEVLRELGLAPVWRLRARPLAAAAPTDEGHAPIDKDARRARIATLDYDAEEIERRAVEFALVMVAAS